MAFSKAFVALALAVFCVHLLSSHGILARQFAEINSEATTMKNLDSRASDSSSSNSFDLGGADQQYGSKSGSGIGPNNKNKNSGFGGSSNDATDDDATELNGSNSKPLSSSNVETKKTNSLVSNQNSDGDNIAAADNETTKKKTNTVAVTSHKSNSSGEDNVDMPKKTAVKP